MSECYLCGKPLDGLGFERQIVELTRRLGYHCCSYNVHKTCFDAAIVAARDTSGVSLRDRVRDDLASKSDSMYSTDDDPARP